MVHSVEFMSSYYILKTFIFFKIICKRMKNIYDIYKVFNCFTVRYFSFDYDYRIF